jgi:hypothetical protein
MNYENLTPAQRATINPLEFLAAQPISSASLGSTYMGKHLDLEGLRVELVHADGGEGDSAPIEKVFMVSDGPTPLFYFEITGTYYSWDDSVWDEGYTIVRPVEVVVTQYHAM